MTAAILELAPQPLLASFPHRVSVPAPWHAQSAARRASLSLTARVNARVPRLRAALSRPRAVNPVAVQRLFAAVAAALGGEVALRRYPGTRHGAVTALALAPTVGGGIRSDALLCLAGKHVDRRKILRIFEASAHATARFVERSGHPGPTALHAALMEAAAHVPAVLVAHLEGGLDYRLRGGTASILLPAGEGAFLGRLRLLPGDRAEISPEIEICTWVHAADLAQGQREALDVLRAGLPVLALLQALPEAWWRLGGNCGGDRRVAEGLVTAPIPPSGSLARQALLGHDLMTLTRLELGLADPETIATALRSAA